MILDGAASIRSNHEPYLWDRTGEGNYCFLLFLYVHQQKILINIKNDQILPSIHSPMWTSWVLESIIGVSVPAFSAYCFSAGPSRESSRVGQFSAYARSLTLLVIVDSCVWPRRAVSELDFSRLESSIEKSAEANTFVLCAVLKAADAIAILYV